MNARRQRAHGERGTALIAAVVLVVLLSATGLGLALTCSLEPAVAANFESAWAALAAAEAAATLAARDLAVTPDWDVPLAGTWRPLLLVPVGPQDVVAGAVPPTSVAALTNLACCRRAEPCGDGDISAVTTDRPWGRNNPAWQLAGKVQTGPGLALETTMPFEAFVWVGDDPAESDGEAASDAAPDPPSRPPPGHGRLLVRAEAFGPRGAHATVEVTAVRRAPGGPVRLGRWRIW